MACNAATFNGTSSFASAPLTLSGQTVITVCMWISWNEAFGAQDDDLAMEYSANHNSNNDSWIWDFQSSSPDAGNIDLGVDHIAGSANLAGITPPSSSAWHHYAVVQDVTGSSGSASIPHVYIDASAQSPTYSGANAGGTAWGNYTLYLMSRAGSALFGTGYCADLAIYSGTLTGANVTSLFNGTSPLSVASGPLYFWHLTGLAGTESNLGSGGASTMTLSNAGTTTNVPAVLCPGPTTAFVETWS
jgi:hypothetical protein